MIARLRGRVAAVDGERAIIEVGGLGLAVNASVRDLARLAGMVGKEAQLSTYLHVREDTLQLYGFAEEPRSRPVPGPHRRERRGTEGGAGGALGLSRRRSSSLAVAQGDAKKFESIPGVGKKLAQRLIVELKDTVGVEMPAGPAAARCRRRARRRSCRRARPCRTSASRCVRPRRRCAARLQRPSVQELVKHALRRARESQ